MPSNHPIARTPDKRLEYATARRVQRPSARRWTIHTKLARLGTALEWYKTTIETGPEVLAMLEEVEQAMKDYKDR